MDACLAADVDYLDTANYEPLDVAKFEYSCSGPYQERFAKQGRMRWLARGFDPGVTNVYCGVHPEAPARRAALCRHRRLQRRLARQGVRDQLPPETQHPRDHGARPVLGDGGEWKETDRSRVEGLRLSRRRRAQELPPLSRGAGEPREEPQGAQAIRFWMTFGESYLKHLEVMQNIGITRIDEVEFEGKRSSRSSSSARCCRIRRRSRRTTPQDLDRRARRGHQGRQAAARVRLQHLRPRGDLQGGRAQAVSYTTGVPAVTGAVMMATGTWKGAGRVQHGAARPRSIPRGRRQARPALDVEER